MRHNLLQVHLYSNILFNRQVRNTSDLVIKMFSLRKSKAKMKITFHRKMKKRKKFRAFFSSFLDKTWNYFRRLSSLLNLCFSTVFLHEVFHFILIFCFLILVIFIFSMSVSFILLLVVYLSISNSSSNVSKYLLCPHFSFTIICILYILCVLFFCNDMFLCIWPKRKFHAIYIPTCNVSA